MEDEKDTMEGGREYPYRVIFPTPEFLEGKGFGRVAYMPFVLDHRPRYHRCANQFLIDIGLGTWSLATRGSEPCLPPTAATMKNYAAWLANYLEYCHRRGKDPLNADYMTDLVQAYQAEMKSGSWSRDNRGLSSKTVNCRVDVACMFQLWAVDKGLRGPFRIAKVRKVLTVDNPRSGGGTRIKTVLARRGKERESKRRLGLPDEKIIGSWLQRVRDKCPTEGLIAETILETAIRRAEAAAWRVDTLPLNPAEWLVVNPTRPFEHQSVLVRLLYATKGGDYGRDHGDKIGPEGQIHVPMPLALKLHHYRQKVRPRALTMALRSAGSPREAEALRQNVVHLFLHPGTGAPYSGQKIYDFWTAPDIECPRGWSPHLGRDFWACSVLWKHISAQQQLVDQATKTGADPSLLKILAVDIEGFIERSIKPQLRHVTRETTLIYLQWASDRLHLNLNLLERYVAQIERGVDEEEL